MKKGISWIFLLAVLFVGLNLSLVSATEAYIHVITKNPDYGLVVRIKDPTTQDIIDSVYGRTNATGYAILNFSTSRNELFYTVMVVNNGQALETKDFGPLSTRGIVYLRFVNETASPPSTPSAPEPSIPSTNTTNNTGVNISENGSQSLTGNVVKETSSFSSVKLNYYIIASVLVGAIVLFIVVRRFRTPSVAPRAPHESGEHAIRPRSVRKPSVPKTLPVNPVQNSPSSEAQPDALDQRIATLEREISRLRGEERLVEAEKRFNTAKQELERLRTEQQRRDGSDSQFSK